MRLGDSGFSLILIGVLLGALAIAAAWPLRSAMIVYWLAGVGVPLALLQIFLDFRGVPWRAVRAGSVALLSDTAATTAARTRDIGLWIGGLVVAAAGIGFHLALPAFVIAYVRRYGGPWISALILAAVVEAFLVLAFDMLISVLWPAPLLFQLFGLSYL